MKNILMQVFYELHSNKHKQFIPKTFHKNNALHKWMHISQAALHISKE